MRYIKIKNAIISVSDKTNLESLISYFEKNKISIYSTGGTYKFLKDGMNNMLLNSAINVDCPIRLLHGRLDQVVSYETSEKIIEKITSKNKKLTIIEDGDHSLSRESDLQLLFDNIRELS